MEDPTVVEGVFDNLIQQIEAGATNEEISNDLNKSILEARLKTSENPSYFVMTINMNGSASVRGGAQKRRDLLSIILRSAFPTALIFCQELPGKFETEVVPEKYHYRRNEKEAAVIWDGDQFDGSSEGFETTNADIRKLRDKIIKERGHASELLPRISMVKLTPLKQEQNESILAVSFHGPYKGKSKEEKCEIFRSLIEFLKEVIKLRRIPSYIVGGDFNFDTLEVALPDKVIVSSTQSSPRSQEKQEKSGRFIPNKDNFIWYPHKAVIISWVRALVFCNENDKSSDLTKEEHKTVHKLFTSESTKKTSATASRATGTTFLPPPKEVRQDLSKNFENISMSDI